jgi:hypothetical protein
MQGQHALIVKIDALAELDWNCVPKVASNQRGVIAPDSKGSSSYSYPWWDSVASLLGMRVSIISTKRQTCLDLLVHMRVEMLCTNYAFRAGGLLRMYPMCGWSFSILRGNAGISCVIADDSAFMFACRTQSLFEVEDLCRKEKGGPTIFPKAT